jgi:hypothetical protein
MTTVITLAEKRRGRVKRLASGLSPYSKLPELVEKKRRRERKEKKRKEKKRKGIGARPTDLATDRRVLRRVFERQNMI